MGLKQLKNMAVETASGSSLGKIYDIVFEIEGQLVAQYYVRPNFISSKKYIVGRDQVVRFEEEKLIVDDAVAKVHIKDEKRKRMPQASPVAMREEV